MPYKDPEKRRIAAAKGAKKWRETHPGRANEVRRDFYYRHRERQCKAARDWYHANKARALAALRVRRLKRYGLTPAEYDALGSACAICGANEDNRVQKTTKKKFRLAVDHDHDTGRVRGLLCGNCNSGIGYLKHDRALLQKAIDYLKGE